MSLKEKVLNSLDDVTCREFGLNKNRVAVFFDLGAADDQKVEVAKEIIGTLLFQHDKDELLQAVEDLSRMEEALRNIGIPDIKIRDHICHSVYTYCLGTYLIKLMHFPIRKFEWMLASILHDIGYPLELVMRLAKQLETISNRNVAAMPVAGHEVVFTMGIKNLSRLSTGQSSIRLMTSRLRDWGLSITAGGCLNEMKRSGHVNHGVISSIFVCKVIEALYRKNNPDMVRGRAHEVERRDWNYDTFFREIVNVTTSIMLHSVPIATFEDGKLDIYAHPLAFLLRFCDELQDWDRVGRNDAFNDPAGYDLSFGNEGIKITLPQGRDDLRVKFSCFSGVAITFE